MKTLVNQIIEILEEKKKILIEMDLSGVLLKNEYIHQLNQLNSLQSIVANLREVEKQQMINFHVEVMKIGLIDEGEVKWSDDYEPRIRKVATTYYNKIFNETIS